MDLLRLAARITLDVASYNKGMDDAERRARTAQQSIKRTTDSVANDTEKANQRVVTSYSNATTAVNEHRDAREELKGSVTEIIESFNEEKRLFEEGRISYEEFTEDVDSLAGEYREATKRLREWDDLVKETNSDVDKSEGSYGNMRKGAMLAVTAISFLSSMCLKEMNRTAQLANSILQGSSYYDVSSAEYQGLSNIFTSNNLDASMTGSVLESVYEIGKKANQGDAQALIALQNAGIDLTSFNEMDSDAARAMFLLNALQGISDTAQRRQTAMDLFGEDMGRQLQFILNGENVQSLYDSANVVSDKSLETERAMGGAKVFRNIFDWIDRFVLKVGTHSEFASGGMFDSGTLYALAGESGAEIVARGARGTGVANVDQIADAQFVAMSDYGLNETIRSAAVAIVNGVADVIREGNGQPVNVIIGGEKVESYIAEAANKQNVVAGRKSIDSVTKYGR